MDDIFVDQPLGRAACLSWMSLERAAAVWALVVDAQYHIVSGVACISGRVAYPYPY